MNAGMSAEWNATREGVQALLSEIGDFIEGVAVITSGSNVAVALLLPEDMANEYQPLIALAQLLFPLWDEVMLAELGG